ncbi:MAG TPA: tRNA pseudouridine(55) synthase TruB [Nitrospirota bacterium]|nr:tRNA pseudouridine(55) synthase TruB [Nitrospirota bacterium]
MDGLLIINKPKGWTSHDVVAKLRKTLSIQKIGHTGTLDPDATGVLCACIGKATRLIEYTSEDEKEYRVIMRLGLTTDTLDAAGKVIKETKDFSVAREVIEEAFTKFTGRISQIPPMYSAVKVGGTPLYRLARQGKEIPRAPREVFIREIRLLEYSGEFVKFDVLCSRGTYVRTLCADIGDHLGVGAHTYSLERLRSGVFTIEDALSIEDVERLHKAGMLSARVIGTDQMVAWMPSVRVKGLWEEGVRHGRGLTSESISGIEGNFHRGDKVRLTGSQGELLSIGTALCDSREALDRNKEKVFKIEKVLV